jgi:plasmid stabilization system protein ParE
VRLRFTPRATKDIANIAEYLRQHSPGAATRVRASIYRGLQHLLIFPLLGREQRQTGARKLVTPRHGYLI